MGWAIEAKGLRELVAAAERLALRPGAPFELAIAGDGAVGEELRARRARGELPAHIEMLGWVTGEQRREEFAAADALVLPTHIEGFPNVLIEAMSCGLPVIATPVGAIPDVVAPGETGLLVPVQDTTALMEAMDRLRNDPAQAAAMGERGIERARVRFDRALAVEKLIQILTRGLPQSSA
jgi:glycosyltransferase involved in cell wall biosynthesis